MSTSNAAGPLGRRTRHRSGPAVQTLQSDRVARVQHLEARRAVSSRVDNDRSLTPYVQVFRRTSPAGSSGAISTCSSSKNERMRRSRFSVMVTHRSPRRRSMPVISERLRRLSPQSPRSSHDPLGRAVRESRGRPTAITPQSQRGGGSGCFCGGTCHFPMVSKATRMVRRSSVAASHSRCQRMSKGSLGCTILSARARAPSSHVRSSGRSWSTPSAHRMTSCMARPSRARIGYANDGLARISKTWSILLSARSRSSIATLHPSDEVLGHARLVKGNFNADISNPRAAKTRHSVCVQFQCLRDGVLLADQSKSC